MFTRAVAVVAGGEMGATAGAIAGTAGASAAGMAADMLNLTANNPPTSDQVQAIADKVDEALRKGKRQ